GGCRASSDRDATVDRPGVDDRGADRIRGGADGVGARGGDDRSGVLQRAEHTAHLNAGTAGADHVDGAVISDSAEGVAPDARAVARRGADEAAIDYVVTDPAQQSRDAGAIDVQDA